MLWHNCFDDHVTPTVVICGDILSISLLWSAGTFCPFHCCDLRGHFVHSTVVIYVNILSIPLLWSTVTFCPFHCCDLRGHFVHSTVVIYRDILYQSLFSQEYVYCRPYIISYLYRLYKLSITYSLIYAIGVFACVFCNMFSLKIFFFHYKDHTSLF